MSTNFFSMTSVQNTSGVKLRIQRIRTFSEITCLIWNIAHGLSESRGRLIAGQVGPNSKPKKKGNLPTP